MFSFTTLSSLQLCSANRNTVQMLKLSWFFMFFEHNFNKIITFYSGSLLVDTMKL